MEQKNRHEEMKSVIVGDLERTVDKLSAWYFKHNGETDAHEIALIASALREIAELVRTDL